MRWQFQCLSCGEHSDVAAHTTTVTPSWVISTCLGCEQACARHAPGWMRLLLVTYGADYVGEDPLTEWDCREFAEELEQCDPSIQLEAETT